MSWWAAIHAVPRSAAVPNRPRTTSAARGRTPLRSAGHTSRARRRRVSPPSAGCGGRQSGPEPPRAASRVSPGPPRWRVQCRIRSLALLLQDGVQNTLLAGGQPPLFHQPQQQLLARAAKHPTDHVTEQAAGHLLIRLAWLVAERPFGVGRP